MGFIFPESESLMSEAIKSETSEAVAGVTPCPFCGSLAEYRDSSYPTQRREWQSWWLLQCANPECSIWASGATKQAALAKWNRRPTARDMLQTDWLKMHRENQNLRTALERIRSFPVHSEPVGGAYEMQDIAHKALSPI